MKQGWREAGEGRERDGCSQCAAQHLERARGEREKKRGRERERRSANQALAVALRLKNNVYRASL